MSEKKIVAPPPGWLPGGGANDTGRTVTIIYDRLGNGAISENAVLKFSHPLTYFELARLVISVLQTALSGIEGATVGAALSPDEGDPHGGN